MLNMKKTAVAVLALASSTVFAGTMGPVCTPGSVTVPCEMSAWDLGAEALYLQSTYGAGLGSTEVSVRDSDGNVSRSGDSNDDRRWSWGYKIEASYHFSTGNDLNVNWYHLNGRNSSVAVGVADPAVAALGDFDNLAAGAVGVLRPRWDAVNVEFGQHVDFGEFKDIRFHGGVQFARIRTRLGFLGAGATENLDPASLEVRSISTADLGATAELRYTGVGPRVGADMSYDLGNGLGVFANGASALLIGENKNRANISSTAALRGPAVDGALVGPQIGDSVTTNVHVRTERTQVVPVLEAKAGLKYGFSMAQGDLTLHAGYMAINYFNAQEVAGADTDYSLHGPFLGLKWVGNVV